MTLTDTNAPQRLPDTGDIDGFIGWLDTRMAAYDNSIHFPGDAA